MSRNAVAAELQGLIEQLQRLNARAEQLAKASGMTDPKWFRGAHTAYTMAAGELDQKGLLHGLPSAEEKVAP